MKASEIKSNKLYYVREKNREDFLFQNIMKNSISASDLEDWFKPATVDIRYPYSDGRVKIRCSNGDTGWWYGDEDLRLVEEYNPYVQEEMEL